MRIWLQKSIRVMLNHMTEKVTAGILKWPLIIAAIVVVLRVILERAGAPNTVSNLASLVMLALVIFPLYFGYRIANTDTPRPYVALLKLVAAYAVLSRLLVIPTYWLAYIYQWPEPRFAAANGGVVGDGITPLTAYIVIPLAALLAWPIGSLVIGGALGSVLIKLKRKPVPLTATRP
jgi:hypothetical protein